MSTITFSHGFFAARLRRTLGPDLRSRMKYDDSEYYFLNFETDLDNEAANTHIGMFLAWAVHAGLARQDERDGRWAADVQAVLARRKTGGQMLSDQCDGKLTDADLNAEGNAFAAVYYDKQYHHDYARVFDSQIPSTGHDADDICSVPDTWANFDLIKPVLDRRLAAWRQSRQTPELSLVGDPPPPSPPPPASPPPGPAPDLAALQRRAEQGDRDAWFELGAEYITGAHVPQDFKRAADCFEKAAQAGLAQAAFNLGVCYQNGEGRPKDAKQRLRWFALAAEGGHGQAAYFLALAYRQGDDLPQDLIASNALMMLAQKRGVAEARQAGVMAGSLAESTALAAQLSEPGQLVALLSARRRKVLAGQADTGVERFKHGPNAGRQPASPDAAPDAERPAAGFGLGHVALLVGAAAVIVLLVLNMRGQRFVGLSSALSLIGAVGVFKVGPSVGVKGATRTLATVLAALPALGSFVNLWMVLRWLGRRSA
jgi:TPR repeat protein